MGKRTVAVIIVVLVIGAAAFGLTRNKTDNDSSQTNTSTDSSRNSSNNQTPANQAPTRTDRVSIQNFAFLPGDITVKKGTAVTWTNNDSTTHTVNEMDGQKGPDSGDLNPGDKYSFTFDQTGSFKYRCNIHPEMLGTVTVTD